VLLDVIFAAFYAGLFIGCLCIVCDYACTERVGLFPFLPPDREERLYLSTLIQILRLNCFYSFKH
jgi:hypothetical protein